LLNQQRGDAFVKMPSQLGIGIAARCAGGASLKDQDIAARRL
jgi:hypothetical protein